MVREWVAVALVVLGLGAFVVVLGATAMDGEWGRVVLVGLGVTACLAGRAIGRYDPDEAAARRAARADLRNRPGSG